MKLGRMSIAARAAAGLLAGGAWAAGAAPDGGRTVFPLTPTELEEPTYGFLPVPPTAKSKPRGAGAMPDFGTNAVSYLDLYLGDGAPRLLAVEAVEAAGPSDDAGAYRVYVDTDGDRELADEKPCVAADDAKMPVGGVLYTPALTLPVVYRVPSGDVSRDYRFRFGFYPAPAEMRARGAPTLYYALVVALQGRSGEVAFGGKTCRLTLSDGNGDAKIAAGADGPADRLALKGAGVELEQELTRCVEVGGTFYELDIRPDGSSVAVSRYAGALGAVALRAVDGAGKPAALSFLDLEGPAARLSSRDAVPAVRLLPAGEYSLCYGFGQGPRVVFRAEEPLVVAAGRTNAVACGGPVALASMVEQTGAADSRALRVNVSATNALGHAFQVTGERVAGTVEVLGPDGKTAGTGNMEYG